MPFLLHQDSFCVCVRARAHACVSVLCARVCALLNQKGLCPPAPEWCEREREREREERERERERAVLKPKS